MSSSIKRLFRRASTQFSGPSMPNSYLDLDKPPLALATLPSHNLNLPRDPNKVVDARHDHLPRQIPSPSADYEEIRYFLYTVLTAKVFAVAKTHPQWVLETCWTWKGTGAELLIMDERSLMLLCPMQAGAAGIDPTKHKVESMPPPEAREMIGTAVVTVLNGRRKMTQAQKDQIQSDWEAEMSRNTSKRASVTSLPPGLILPSTQSHLATYRQQPMPRGPGAEVLTAGWSLTDQPLDQDTRQTIRRVSSPTPSETTWMAPSTAQRFQHSMHCMQATPAIPLAKESSMYSKPRASTVSSICSPALSSLTNSGFASGHSNSTTKTSPPNSESSSRAKESIAESEDQVRVTLPHRPHSVGSITSFNKLLGPQSSLASAKVSSTRSPLYRDSKKRHHYAARYKSTSSSAMSNISRPMLSLEFQEQQRGANRRPDLFLGLHPASSPNIPRIDKYTAAPSIHELSTCRPGSKPTPMPQHTQASGELINMTYIESARQNNSDVPAVRPRYDSTDVTLPQLDPYLNLTAHSSPYMRPSQSTSMLNFHIPGPPLVYPGCSVDMLRLPQQYQEPLPQFETVLRPGLDRILTDQSWPSLSKTSLYGKPYFPNSGQSQGQQEVLSSHALPAPEFNTFPRVNSNRSIRSSSPTRSVCTETSFRSQRTLPSTTKQAIAAAFMSGIPVHQKREVPVVPACTSETRPINNSKVDAHALAQADYNLWKSYPTSERMQVIQAERERLGIIRPHLVDQSGRTDKSESLRMQGMMPSNLRGQQNLSGPSVRHVDPRTRQPRRTLFEAIEDKEILEGKIPRGMDRNAYFR